jgi:hypothetical protein
MSGFMVGQKVQTDGGVGVVVIAEGEVVFVDTGARVCRYQKCPVTGRYSRDYYQPEGQKLGHDELSLLND